MYINSPGFKAGYYIRFLCKSYNKTAAGRAQSAPLQLLFFVYFSQRAHLYVGGALITCETGNYQFGCQGLRVSPYGCRRRILQIDSSPVLWNKVRGHYSYFTARSRKYSFARQAVLLLHLFSLAVSPSACNLQCIHNRYGSTQPY